MNVNGETCSNGNKLEKNRVKMLVSGFLGMAIGFITNSMAYTADYPSDMMWFYILSQFLVLLQVTIAWLTPPLVIQILLEYFNVTCNSAQVNLFEKCKECLDIHDTFVKSFRYFLFAYFIFNQSFGIFYIFTVLSQAMGPTFLSTEGTLMSVLGNTGGIICIIFALIGSDRSPRSQDVVCACVRPSVSLCSKGL